jgi:hypothetical protein
VTHRTKPINTNNTPHPLTQNTTNPAKNSQKTQNQAQIMAARERER